MSVTVYLPSTLMPLFPGLARKVDLDAATVAEALGRLNESFPGLEARICEPGPRLRQHVHVYVDRRRAELSCPLRAGSRVDVVAAISGG